LKSILSLRPKEDREEALKGGRLQAEFLDSEVKGDVPLGEEKKI
jgi:hypothetical protein